KRIPLLGSAANAYICARCQLNCRTRWHNAHRPCSTYRIMSKICGVWTDLSVDFDEWLDGEKGSDLIAEADAQTGKQRVNLGNAGRKSLCPIDFAVENLLAVIEAISTIDTQLEP